jgi:hypothetical protein
VSWNDNQPEGFLWSDTVWVFVDYNKNGVMTRLPVTSATATAGTVTKVQGNDKGVWVVGNARSAGSFSATVRLLTDITDVAGACAYASNYPPVGEYKTYKQLVFTGTPMYNLVLRHLDNKTDTIYRVSDGNYDLPEDYILVSFTDATGAPGRCTESSAVPPLAVSATKWYFGGQTWSDVIYATPTGCTSVNSPTSNPTRGEYAIKGGIVYYNWQCMRENASTLCPPPWRVPNIADVAYFKRATMASEANAEWTTGRGWLAPGYSYVTLTAATYFYLDEPAAGAYYYLFETGGNYGIRILDHKGQGMIIRCVK